MLVGLGSRGHLLTMSWWLPVLLALFSLYEFSTFPNMVPICIVSAQFLVISSQNLHRFGDFWPRFASFWPNFVALTCINLLKRIYILLPCWELDKWTERNTWTKPYIEATCCLKIRTFGKLGLSWAKLRSGQVWVGRGRDRMGQVGTGDLRISGFRDLRI